MREMTAEITPNAKKYCKREEDSAKKTRHMKKKELLKFFGEGPQVPAPLTEGTSIKVVKKRRDNKADGSPGLRKRDPATSDESNQCKKMQSDNEKSKKSRLILKGWKRRL
jgi:hypothetical protein